jgi:hypothetical protein
MRADPALASKETGHALPFGNVLEIVPVVKLVLGSAGEIRYRDQDAPCHRSLHPLLVEVR